MIEMGAPEPPAGKEVAVQWNEVGTDYFKAVGQPLLAGRAFEDRDDTTTAPIIIITRAMANAVFPGKPLDQVVGRALFSWREERMRREIVGVVDDITYGGAADTRRPIIYVPVRQGPRSFAGMVLRIKGSPAPVLAAARRELATLDPSIAMATIQTMGDALAQTIAPQRFNAILFSVYAALAVLLAAVGLYGVLSYNVARDTREIGVRIALGASSGAVMGRVLARSLALAGAGAALGIVGSLVAARAMGALLFEVKPSDPVTLVAVTVLVLVVAALASWIPARRAIHVDPAVALRSD
jgi:putative ABC transport system permease protein